MASETKVIVNLRTGACVCACEPADRPLARMRGLIGRRELPAGDGLLLTPAPSIHTAFMRFAIDAVFLDRELRVLKIVERLRPWRAASARGARAVLELAAGECARRDVCEGDRLDVRERGPVERVVEDYPTDATHASAPTVSESIIWPTSLEQNAHLTAKPDRPAPKERVRVLVVSRDRHFRSVTSTLLAHRGCVVDTTAKASGVDEVINGGGADVIVIEAGRFRSPAQTVAAAALAHPVGIVVVDESPAGTHQPRVLAKWGPFEELFAAIEDAAYRRESLQSTSASG